MDRCAALAACLLDPFPQGSIHHGGIVCFPAGSDDISTRGEQPTYIIVIESLLHIQNAIGLKSNDLIDAPSGLDTDGAEPA